MAIGLCHRLQCLLPDCNRLQYQQTALQPIAIRAPNNNKQRVLKRFNARVDRPLSPLSSGLNTLIYD